jgi:hypothetical protein
MRSNSAIVVLGIVLEAFYDAPHQRRESWEYSGLRDGGWDLILTADESDIHKHALESTKFARYLGHFACRPRWEELFELTDVDAWDERNVLEFLRHKSGNPNMPKSDAMNLWAWLAPKPSPVSPRAVVDECLDFADGWRSNRKVKFCFKLESNGVLCASIWRSDLDRFATFRADVLTEGQVTEEMDELGFEPMP